MNKIMKSCLDSGLRLEAYLVLHCIYNNELDILIAYYTDIGKIPTKVFQDLVSDGYLTFSGEDDKYTLDNIKLTDKFERSVLKIKEVTLTFEEAFTQLRGVYPKKCPDGRRLHTDLDTCRRKYRAIIVKNQKVVESIHLFILQCTNFLIAEQAKLGKLDFLSALPAYINQKGWKTVEEDVSDIVNKGGKIKDAGSIKEYSENKTQKGGEDFL